MCSQGSVMTRGWTGHTMVAIGALVLGAALAPGLESAPAAGAPAGEAGPDSERVARVEGGLLPAVSIRGRPDTTFWVFDRMQRYGVPAVSIAVIDGGRLAWARTYGVLEAGGSRRADTATLFQAGSISKAITAVAALSLVDAGVLSLDEDVNQQLVSWKIPANEWTRSKPVTLRRLLSHGAGINVPSYPGYRAGEPVPTLRQVLDGARLTNTPPVRVEIAPGTEWRYSGGGFTVVQELIVEASGRSFADVLKETVLGPAGMTATLAQQPLTSRRAGNAAVGQSAGAPVAGRWRVYPELAAAGLWSTASDLARFGVAVLRAIRGETGALLKPGTARELATRQIGDWGLGFALGGGTGAGDSATVGHDGSTVGYIARLRLLPATGQGVAIMTNGESEALLDEIERAVAREYAWPVKPRVEKSVAAVDPAGYEPLVGRYRVVVGARTFDFVVSVDGDGSDRRLIITGPSGRSGELLPLSTNRFFAQDTGNEFTFTRDGNTVSRMLIDQQGQSFTARRLGASP